MTDYVRKEELKEFFEGITISVAGRTKAEAISVVFQAIYNGAMKLPTTGAEPVRHGKWKKIKGAINCSACKNCSWSTSFEGLVSSFNYCPNCGAKMRGEKE